MYSETVLEHFSNPRNVGEIISADGIGHTGNPVECEASLELSYDKMTLKHAGILKSEQIQRYLRHIIMPEISDAGQKKLLASHVLICAPSIENCDLLLFYMAAAGIGHIYCYFENPKRNDVVLSHVTDLNPDIQVELFDGIDYLTEFLLKSDCRLHFNIVIGESDFISKISNRLLPHFSHGFPPTLLATGYSWDGYVKVCCDMKSIHIFLSDISKKHAFSSDVSSYHELGKLLSLSFIGPLATVEAIKSCLGIGNQLNDMLYFNLLTMSFEESEHTKCNVPFDSIDMNKRLSKIKTLIVGTGGLGSSAAFALAKAGIGTIGLIDFDHVEISNLNRQILHSTSKIGITKVESARQTLTHLFPNVNVLLYPIAFSSDNAMELVKDFDIVVDGLDNFPTRYLLNDSCYFSNKTFVEAGILSFYGLTTTMVRGKGPCYRCIFPQSANIGPMPSRSETGVLGPVPGLIGVLEATEVIKTALGIDSSLTGKMLMYNALEADFTVLAIERNDKCTLCGKHPNINSLGEDTFTCSDRNNE